MIDGPEILGDENGVFDGCPASVRRQFLLGACDVLDDNLPRLYTGVKPALLLISDAALFALTATGHAPPTDADLFKLVTTDDRTVYVYVAPPDLTAYLGVFR